MEEKLNALIDATFDEMIEKLQGLVQIDSSPAEELAAPGAPFGPGCAQALAYTLTLAQELGFQTRNLDGYAGYAEFGPPDAEVVGVLAHLDVVPAPPAGWSRPPFAAEVTDGNIYGRGTEDDKGPLLASLYAMKAVREAGLPLTKRVRLICGCDEETGSRCIKHYLAEEGQFACGFSPDGLFPIYNAEKGIARVSFSKPFPADSLVKEISGGTKLNMVPDTAAALLDASLQEALSRSIAARGLQDDLSVSPEADGLRLKARGVTVHSMEPEKGKNAILLLLHALAGIEAEDAGLADLRYLAQLGGLGSDGREMGIACADEVSGPLTLNVAIIELKDGLLTWKLDVRYPVTADGAQILATLADKAQAGGFAFMRDQWKLPLYVPEETPFIQALVQAYEGVTGEKAELLSMGGGTYCRFVENAVSFGPVFPGKHFTAHQVDEFISLDDLRQAAKIYAQAIYLLAK